MSLMLNSIFNAFRRQRVGVKTAVYLILLLLTFFLIFQAFNLIRALRNPRNSGFFQWTQGNEATRTALITVQRDACDGAPFILPADGFIGLLYEDPRGPYSVRTPHQGIDIFTPDGVGVTPVYAAYDGYITREPSWRSSLIQRIPEDPLNPERQVWLYYTHMADRNGNDFIEPAFPQGTREFFVEQGTLLGYTGNYSGNAARPVGIHLHFSIVLDDGNGRYKNELEFNNTIDPSPYLGLMVNYKTAPERIECAEEGLS